MKIAYRLKNCTFYISQTKGIKQKTPYKFIGGSEYIYYFISAIQTGHIFLPLKETTSLAWSQKIHDG